MGKGRFVAEGPVFYHGTSRDGAHSLVGAQTFDPSRLQARDHGFFGEGFYCATTPRGARFYSGIVLEVTLRPGARVLDAVEGSGITPDHVPKYFSAYAADLHERVMRFRSSETRADEAVADAKPPFAGDRFGNRLSYYKDVTGWARRAGYDAIAWGSEVIVLRPEAVAGIRRVKVAA